MILNKRVKSFRWGSEGGVVPGNVWEVAPFQCLDIEFMELEES